VSIQSCNRTFEERIASNRSLAQVLFLNDTHMIVDNCEVTLKMSGSNLAYCVGLTQKVVFACGSMVLSFFCRFFFARWAKKNLQRGKFQAGVHPIVLQNGCTESYAIMPSEPLMYMPSAFGGRRMTAVLRLSSFVLCKKASHPFLKRLRISMCRHINRATP
jgi:hypothetical protein